MPMTGWEWYLQGAKELAVARGLHQPVEPKSSKKRAAWVQYDGEFGLPKEGAEPTWLPVAPIADGAGNGQASPAVISRQEIRKWHDDVQ